MFNALILQVLTGEKFGSPIGLGASRSITALTACLFWSVLVVLLRPELVSPGLLAELQLSTVPFSTCFLQMARIVFGAGGLVPGSWAWKSWIRPGRKSMPPLLLRYSNKRKFLSSFENWGAMLTDDDQFGRKCSEPVMICRKELWGWSFGVQDCFYLTLRSHGSEIGKLKSMLPKIFMHLITSLPKTLFFQSKHFMKMADIGYEMLSTFMEEHSIFMEEDSIPFSWKSPHIYRTPFYKIMSTHHF